MNRDNLTLTFNKFQINSKQPHNLVTSLP